VAGNAMTAEVVGSLVYAPERRGTPLVVVLGHQNCGAVTAALQGMTNPALRKSPGIGVLLKLLGPGLKDVDKQLPKAKRVAAGVEANVRWSVRRLLKHPAGKPLSLKTNVTSSVVFIR
jgi:carbonic anhydrase